jgi:2-dehydropantoate 2-reductase
VKILVYGAGVLGSLYAARLHETGHDVTLVARGARLKYLTEHGVQLAEGDSPVMRSVRVPVVGSAVGSYDLILVFVRSHQVDVVLESIAGVGGDVLFLLNWAAGPDAWATAIGRERVLLGFANQGGTFDGDVVRYRRSTPLTRLVSMPIGEVDGTTTPRLERILGAFRSSGFTAKAEPRMDAWLKTHAAFEVPLGQAVHAAGGLDALASDASAIRAMIQLMRRNLKALPGRPVPFVFSALRTMPEGLLVSVFRRFLHSSAAEPLNTNSPAVSAELDLLAAQIHAFGPEL